MKNSQLELLLCNMFMVSAMLAPQKSNQQLFLGIISSAWLIASILHAWFEHKEDADKQARLDKIKELIDAEEEKES